MRHLKIEALKGHKTWYDRDYIMFHACFQVLVDFIEKEFVCNNLIDWDTEEKTKGFVKNEMIDLYDWYMQYCLDLYDETVYIPYEDEIEDAQFKRLMNIRRGMWT